MRLLSPAAHKEALEDETRVARKNLAEILSAIDEGISNLNKLRDATEKHESESISSHREIAESLTQDNIALRAEVEELESRKALALKPIEDRIKECEDKEKSLDDRSRKLDERTQLLESEEHKLQTAIELYENKLDDLADREIGIKEAEESLAMRIKDYTDTDAQRTKDFSNRSQLLYEKARELAQQEQRIVDVASSLETARATLESEKKKLAQEKIHISSQQSTLKSAFEEARKKGII